MKTIGSRLVSAAASVSLFTALGTLLVFGAASAGATGTAARSTLPNACKLLRRSEAQQLVGIRLQPAVGFGTNCTYNPYPTGRVAQVSVYVDSTIPRTLQIDRQLKHRFWSVRGIGDKALVEDANIFARKGKIWVTIHVVPLEPWPAYRKRLERAARIAISRVPAPKRRAASSSAAGPPAVGGRERWTGKERRFGGSITYYRGVVYQPGVVVIGGGARAIRSRSADGLTWMLDAAAPGASDLRVGKVMLATAFAAGRVLKLTHAGSNLRVVLGPVALTDIIRDGEFESHGPVRISRPLLYRSPVPQKPTKKRHGRSTAAAAGRPMGSATPFCCEGGMGVHLWYRNGDDGKLSATVALVTKRVSIDFHLRIGGGKLIDAGLQVSGLGGLRYDINGSTMNGTGNMVLEPQQVPEVMTIPLAGPFAITITQYFDASMQFVGRATMHTKGEYELRGTLGFGYDGGKPSPAKLDMETKTPVSESTLSLGVGVNAIKIGYALRATVGVGAVVFEAGAWGKLRAGLALVADGSHLMSLDFGCTTVGLDVSDMFGVGFSVADFIRKPINFLLGLLRIKPIPPQGGVAWGPYTVWHPPDKEWCPPRKEAPPKSA